MASDNAALLDVLEATQEAGVEDRVRTAAQTIYRALIEAELTSVIGAGPWERTDQRTSQRNGSRSRTLTTTAGDLELRIPKLRVGSFFRSLLERRRRVGQALLEGGHGGAGAINVWKFQSWQCQPWSPRLVARDVWVTWSLSYSAPRPYFQGDGRGSVSWWEPLRGPFSDSTRTSRHARSLKGCLCGGPSSRSSVEPHCLVQRAPGSETVGAMTHTVYPPADRPEVEVLVNGTRHHGELRMWDPAPGRVLAGERDVDPAHGEHQLDTFPAENVRPLPA
jgi:hypothetical protein